MVVENLNEILEKSNSLSDLSRYIFGKENYTNREKCKKILEENGVNWQEWLENKKRTPNYCLYCGKEIIGRDRFIKKFCNNTCSLNYQYDNNIRKTNNDYKCLYCGGTIKHSKTKRDKKYCSKICYVNHQNEIKLNKWRNGEESGCDISGEIKIFLRNYLLKKADYKCQECGYNKLNQYTGRTILQIHHIDGNCFNTKEENLKVLCPNCHALTENFGNRNKNSTRIDRRSKYYREGNLEGKIRGKKTEKKEKVIVKIVEKKEYDLNTMIFLLKELKSFTKVGKAMGVSDNAIKKRFIKHGYPSSAKEILKMLD